MPPDQVDETDVGHCEDCGRRVQGRHELQTSDALGAAASQLGPRAHAALAICNKEIGPSHGKCKRLFAALFGITIARASHQTRCWWPRWASRADHRSASQLPPDEPLFHVPRQLVKVLDRDLKVAGIAKTDERGRTLDIHAMRHTFGTLLSAGGVAPRVAQSAMRHSRIDLTMNVYTDPKLLDVRGAMEVLPDLPLDAMPNDEKPARATARTNGRLVRLHQCLHQNLADPAYQGQLLTKRTT